MQCYCFYWFCEDIIPLSMSQKFLNIFVLPDFCLGFPLSNQATDEMRFETDGRSAAFSWSKQVLPASIQMTQWVTGLSLAHLSWISLLLRTWFFFDIDGVTLCT